MTENTQTQALVSRRELEEMEQRASKSTEGPLTFEKHESFLQGSWHYAIHTVKNMPEHPHSPRFVAWMCGSLGESLPSRNHPEDYRSDPQIEADADFFAHSRTDLPRLVASYREAMRLVSALAEMEHTYGNVNDLWCAYCDAHISVGQKHEDSCEFDSARTLLRQWEEGT